MTIEILTRALDGAARGHLIGSSARANRQAALNASASNGFQAQAVAYLSLLMELETDYEELIQKYNDNIDSTERLKDRLLGTHKQIRTLNAEKLGLWEDRQRAYAFIEEMAGVIREMDDIHPILDNPNAVLSEVQQGSKDAMDKAIDLFKAESDAQFSLAHSFPDLQDMSDLRVERGRAYNKAVQNGETKVVDADTYGKPPL